MRGWAWQLTVSAHPAQACRGTNGVRSPSCRSSVFPFREELCQFDTIPLYRFRRVFPLSCLSMLFRTARPCCVVVGVSSRRIRMVAATSALFRESKSLPTCLHRARSCCSSAEPSKHAGGDTCLIFHVLLVHISLYPQVFQSFANRQFRFHFRTSDLFLPSIAYFGSVFPESWNFCSSVQKSCFLDIRHIDFLCAIL